jgi:hypothetical protein
MNPHSNASVSIGRQSAVNPRHETFFFDFSTVPNLAKFLKRYPERVASMCQVQVRNIAPGELMVPDNKGFYLVVRTRRGAAAEALAWEINHALHQRLFGTRSSSAMVSTFRAVTPGTIVELDINPDRQRAMKSRNDAYPEANPPPARSAAAPSSRTDFQPWLLPVFNLQCQAAPIGLCGAGLDKYGQKLFGSDALRFCDQQYRPSIDLSVLEFSLALRGARPQTEFGGIIAACVGYETLAWSRSRQLYQEALRAARRLGDSDFIIKIDDVPVGTPASRLADMITSLRPFVKRVFVQLPHWDSTLLHSGRIGLSGLCVRLAPRMTAPDLTRLASWLQRTALVQQTFACAIGVPASTTFRLLRDSGIDYASQLPGNSNISVGTRPLAAICDPIKRAA